MSACSLAAGEALACFSCACITWKSLLGLVLPVGLCFWYLRRVLDEATVDDWLLLAFGTILTYASRSVSDIGLSHQPWVLYMVTLWACIGCTTDQTARLRSVPLVGFMVFVSLVIPDIAGALTAVPHGRIAIPGGNGLLDGLVLKPAAGMLMTWTIYWAKANPRFRRISRPYDDASREFLLNMSASYRRPAELFGALRTRQQGSGAES